MSENKQVVVNGGGIGCLTTIFIVFLILKLTKVIAWSWWWVCSPLILSVAFTAIMISILVLIAIIAIIAVIKSR